MLLGLTERLQEMRMYPHKLRQVVPLFFEGKRQMFPLRSHNSFTSFYLYSVLK